MAALPTCSLAIIHVDPDHPCWSAQMVSGNGSWHCVCHCLPITSNYSIPTLFDQLQFCVDEVKIRWNEHFGELSSSVDGSITGGDY